MNGPLTILFHVLGLVLCLVAWEFTSVGPRGRVCVDRNPVDPPGSPTERVTFLIKTHERREFVERTLRNIRAWYPTMRGVVVDDSREPKPLDGVMYCSIEYDTGLGAGRNELVRRAETDFVMMLDDDIVFRDPMDIPATLELMEQNSLDIVAFRFFQDRNISEVGCMQLRPSVGADASQSTTTLLSTCHNNPSLPGTPCFLCNDVSHQFLGRTEALRRMGGWDERLKTGGNHMDFVVHSYRAGLRMAFCPNLMVYHDASLASRREDWFFWIHRSRKLYYKRLSAHSWDFKLEMEASCDTASDWLPRAHTNP